MNDVMPCCPCCGQNLTKVEQSGTLLYCTNSDCIAMTFDAIKNIYYVKGNPESEVRKWQD